MNPYIVAGGVLAVVCAYGVGHWQGDDAGQAKIQAKWDQERAKLAGQSGCSGKDLHRESATDIVKLAMDADELRIALKQCYAQYDSLK